MRRKSLHREDLDRHFCVVALVGTLELCGVCIGVVPLAMLLFGAV